MDIQKYQFNLFEINWPVPEIQLNLNRLEKVLISQNILIKKVYIMPKGRFPKLKGGINYIAID